VARNLLDVKVELRLVDNGLQATLEHRPQSRVLLLQLKVPHLSRGTAISVSRSRALDTQSGVHWPLVDWSGDSGKTVGVRSESTFIRWNDPCMSTSCGSVLYSDMIVRTQMWLLKGHVAAHVRTVSPGLLDILYLFTTHSFSFQRSRLDHTHELSPVAKSFPAQS